MAETTKQSQILATLTLPPDCQPEDLAVSPSGILAVADSGPARNIRLFDATTGRARGTFGTSGGALAPGRYQGDIRATGALFAPRALDIDGKGNLYVLDSLADGLAPRIAKFAPSSGRTNWDARSALWVAQGQVIGAGAVIDPTDPSVVVMRGVEGEVSWSATVMGGWKPRRLSAPFGQRSWASLPADLPESRIPAQEAGIVGIGGKRFRVHWDFSGALALTSPDDVSPFPSRPCLLLSPHGNYHDADNDGRLEPIPAGELPPVLDPSLWQTEYVARYRLDLGTGDLWAWSMGTASVTRFRSIGLDKSSDLPAWDWQGGGETFTVPGLVMNTAAPRDFVPVTDADGPALYVWPTAEGEPDERYYLRRYTLTGNPEEPLLLSWERYTGQYQIYNRDRYMGHILSSGVDGEWNQPVTFVVPPLSRFVFLGYNTGLQVEALDVATGEGVALLRPPEASSVWLDAPNGVVPLFVVRIVRRGQERYLVTGTDNFKSRVVMIEVMIEWTP